MGRTMVRTRTVPRDDVVRIVELFGSIRNAHRKLGLVGLLDYTNVFYRAMQHYPILPQDVELIMERWARWKELYLNPKLPVSALFDLDEGLVDKAPWEK